MTTVRDRPKGERNTNLQYNHLVTLAGSCFQMLFLAVTFTDAEGTITVALYTKVISEETRSMISSSKGIQGY